MHIPFAVPICGSHRSVERIARATVSERGEPWVVLLKILKYNISLLYQRGPKNIHTKKKKIEAQRTRLLMLYPHWFWFTHVIRPTSLFYQTVPYHEHTHQSELHHEVRSIGSCSRDVWLHPRELPSFWSSLKKISLNALTIQVMCFPHEFFCFP